VIVKLLCESLHKRLTPELLHPLHMIVAERSVTLRAIASGLTGAPLSPLDAALAMHAAQYAVLLQNASARAIIISVVAFTVHGSTNIPEVVIGKPLPAPSGV
jgi:hypothetical protein